MVKKAHFVFGYNTFVLQWVYNIQRTAKMGFLLEMVYRLQNVRFEKIVI